MFSAGREFGLIDHSLAGSDGVSGVISAMHRKRFVALPRSLSLPEKLLLIVFS